MGVLVTGGAGYIGGHVIQALRRAGRSVAVVDDLSTGLVERIGDVPLLRADLAEAATVPALAAFCAEHRIRAVLHLAARKRVDESVQRPQWYVDQNVGGTAHVIEAATRADVPHLVLSSSAAVYGSPAVPLVDEDAPTAPVNPYGETKLESERLVREAIGLRSIALRYFNVAGATGAALRDITEANLVTIVLARLARGEAPLIFGTDYPTPDGTCIRDLVHVGDVADAHLRALDAMEQGDGAHDRVLNVGTGRGASVLEIARRLLALDGRHLDPVLRPRRPGDPAAVVADVTRIRAELGWSARFRLDETLRSAWAAVREVPAASR
jgi:UDP-glucose 4-epimerase